MTFPQIRALVVGHRRAEAADDARAIINLRVAVWGDADAVREHLERLGAEDDAAADVRAALMQRRREREAGQRAAAEGAEDG